MPLLFTDSLYRDLKSFYLTHGLIPNSNQAIDTIISQDRDMKRYIFANGWSQRIVNENPYRFLDMIAKAINQSSHRWPKTEDEVSIITEFVGKLKINLPRLDWTVQDPT